ncbi:MAG: hypothetical protein EBT61_22445, partial [Verrucomicrobia bacterium]|nr:hypothetical protein [Verrucomicrobiota bacterium]
MTFVEVMVATSIGTMILAAAGSLMVYNARSLAALSNYADLDRYSRTAVDKITRDIRQSPGLTSFTTNQIQLTSSSGGTISYTYYSDLQQLVRLEGANREVLLKECTNLVFTVYSRNNISNTWDQFAVGDASSAKLIKLNWTCTRSIMGQAVNT